MLKVTTKDIKDLLVEDQSLFDEVAERLYERLGGSYGQTREGEYFETGTVFISEVGQALQDWVDRS